MRAESSLKGVIPFNYEPSYNVLADAQAYMDLCSELEVDDVATLLSDLEILFRMHWPAAVADVQMDRSRSQLELTYRLLQERRLETSGLWSEEPATQFIESFVEDDE